MHSSDHMSVSRDVHFVCRGTVRMAAVQVAVDRQQYCVSVMHMPDVVPHAWQLRVPEAMCWLVDCLYLQRRYTGSGKVQGSSQF